MKKLVMYNTFFSRPWIGALFVLLMAAACNPLLQKAQSYDEAAAYNAAIPIYKKYLQKHPEKSPFVNFRIGECYRKSNRLHKALPYYKTALSPDEAMEKLESSTRDSLRFFHATALKAAGQYDSAALAFEAYAEDGLNFLEAAKREREHLKELDVIPTKTYTRLELCPELNTPSADFAPSLLQKGNKLVFSSARRNEERYQGNGQGFLDLYQMQLTENGGLAQGTPALLPLEIINLDGVHEASATYNAEGTLLIFARSGAGEKDEEEKEVSLYESRYDAETKTWSTPQLLKYISSTNTWDGCPHLSHTGDTLFFASNRSGGEGGTDLYRATKNSEGVWVNAEALTEYNTPGNEMFPHIGRKGNLFFASDGYAGFGGLDIFATTKKGEIYNVGKPINSLGDDFGLMFVNDTTGYFSSNRENPEAKGDDDIYRFINDSINRREVVYLLAGKTMGSSYENNRSTPLEGVTIKLRAEGKEIEAAVSNSTGAFKFKEKLKIGTPYTLIASKDGYLGKTTIFPTENRGVTDLSTLPQIYNEITFDTLLTLTKNLLDTRGPEPPEIEILYDLDSDKITAESAKKLDKFVVFLEEYLKVFPDVVIELGSHTDARGSSRYNRNLAQRRANSAVKYITDKGVDKEKIAAKGYGEDELKIKNAKTEDEHQQNRRTTIKVFKADEYKR